MFFARNAFFSIGMQQKLVGVCRLRAVFSLPGFLWAEVRIG